MKHPLAQRFLFKLLDIDHKGYLDVKVLRQHLMSVQERYAKEKEIQEPESSTFLREIDVMVVSLRYNIRCKVFTLIHSNQTEIFDAANPSEEGGITLQGNS